MGLDAQVCQVAAEKPQAAERYFLSLCCAGCSATRHSKDEKMRRTISMLVVILALSYSLLPPQHFAGAISAYAAQARSSGAGQVDSTRHRGSGPTPTSTATMVPPTAIASATPAPPSATSTATSTASSTASPTVTATGTSVPASATATATGTGATSLLVNGGFDQTGA